MLEDGVADMTLLPSGDQLTKLVPPLTLLNGSHASLPTSHTSSNIIKLTVITKIEKRNPATSNLNF